ncbi:MAG: hypothetical protein HY922_01855 [Elusimicrobia bacterium]|nr:hypothetical protein [Elusimicrobiota bacterium]
MAEQVTPEQVVVFEAVNDTLKEFYVGISILPLTADEIANQHKEKPPAAIAHWKREHQVWYRCVDAGLSAPDSQAFIYTYTDKISRPGWKALAG